MRMKQFLIKKKHKDVLWCVRGLNNWRECFMVVISFLYTYTSSETQ